MLKKRLFLLLLLTVAFAFSIRLFIPRYQVYKHIDETMIIDEKKDMETYAGYWAELTYDYCFSGMYMAGPWIEDKRGYGVFKISGKDEFVYGSTDGAFEYWMNGKNFFFQTNQIKEMEPYTVEGYILKIPQEDKQILLHQAQVTTGEFKFVNTEEQTNYSYVLQLKDRDKEKMLFPSFLAFMIVIGFLWVICIIKTIKQLKK